MQQQIPDRLDLKLVDELRRQFPPDPWERLHRQRSEEVLHLARDEMERVRRFRAVRRQSREEYVVRDPDRDFAGGGGADLGANEVSEFESGVGGVRCAGGEGGGGDFDEDFVD